MQSEFPNRAPVKPDAKMLATAKKEIDKETAREGKLRNDDLQQDINMRKEYAEKSFHLCCIYLACVFVIVMLCGYSSDITEMDSGFRLSDSVLCTLLGTTTVTVIGIYHTVVKHIFPRH